jgi:hypothetical protein
MQRKPTKNTRGPSSSERDFQAWTKEQDCICCGNSPVIVDHVEGSTKKAYVGVERVLVGHWYVLPLCIECDTVKTSGSRKVFRERFGSPAELWAKHASNYLKEIPAIIKEAINEIR